MNCNEDILHDALCHSLCDDYDDCDCDERCCYTEKE